MARTLAVHPAGAPVTDYTSVADMTGAIQASKVRPVLANASQAGARQRAPPAPAVVYHVIALALHAHSSYREDKHPSRPLFNPATQHHRTPVASRPSSASQAVS